MMESKFKDLVTKNIGALKQQISLNRNKASDMSKSDISLNTSEITKRLLYLTKQNPDFADFGQQISFVISNIETEMKILKSELIDFLSEQAEIDEKIAKTFEDCLYSSYSIEEYIEKNSKETNTIESDSIIASNGDNKKGCKLLIPSSEHTKSGNFVIILVWLLATCVVLFSLYKIDPLAFERIAYTIQNFKITDILN
jgi:hypothetical protein